MKTQELAIEGGVAVLSLVRATSLDRRGKRELTETVAGIDANTRALIIHAVEPRAFLVDVAELADLSPAEALSFSRAGHALADAIEALPFPVVAAVEGPALGGGCELVLACDLAVAGARASFGQIEALGGVLPAFGGTWRLVRRVGHQRALEMLFTGRVLDAATAKEAGLVLEVTAEGGALAGEGGALAGARAVVERMLPARAASLTAIKHAVVRARASRDADAIEEALFPTLFGPEQSERMHAYLKRGAS